MAAIASVLEDTANAAFRRADTASAVWKGRSAEAIARRAKRLLNADEALGVRARVERVNGGWSCVVEFDTGQPYADLQFDRGYVCGVFHAMSGRSS